MAAPRFYRLTLEPDLAARRFAGRVVIGLEGDGPVILDSVDLDIQGVEADGAPVPWSLAEGRLNVEAGGAGEIAVAYSGPIGEEPRGLYSDGDWLLSQMQPTHARRVFPCFDDPAHRCPCELSVRADPALTAIGNGPVARRENGWTHFAPTPPLPTNLLALAVGRFEGAASQVAGIALTLYGLDGQAPRDALAFNTAWHGRPPALGKLDILAAPRLDMAGMENIGAIFLRADALGGPERDVRELVAHEIAHQWFGGVVSSASWRDLWLNEGFATWMAAKFVRSQGPDPAYDAVQARAARAAMTVDTRPLRREARTEAEIAERFDIAAYRKGAALLALLEAWLGEDVFRAGVRRYLAEGEAAGGTVTADDLWAALEAASGQPVALVAAPLAERAGVPTLGFSRDGDDLVIRQLGEPRVMPVFLRTAAGVRTLLLKSVEARLPAAGWAYGNARALGYYRCRHDFEVPLAGLDEAEIVALQEDAWDAAWDGSASLIDYLDLAGRLLAAGRGLDTLGPRLDELTELLAGGPRRGAFEAWRAAAPPRPAPPSEDEAGRAAFRQSQQAAFDAWLLRREAPGAPHPGLMAEHRTVNALAAALRGALWLRQSFDAEGLAAPPWMQAAGDLANVLASVERLALQQARGQPCAPDLSQLIKRMADDLAACAVLADRALGRLAGGDPAAPRHVALLLGREAVSREREFRGARTFAALFGWPPPAAPPDAAEASAWLERTRKPIWRNDRLALREDAANLAAGLRARAARLIGADPAPPPDRVRRSPLAQTGKPVRLILPDGSAVKADYPQDPVLRAQGLMHRDRLAADEGMLFFLPDAGPHAFFMRGVRMALDILWLDAEGQVLHAETGEPGSESALPADLTRALGRWVLELAAGEAARRGLAVGAKVAGLPEPSPSPASGGRA
jgi:puromycin-sensitive aminopeptidase